MSENPPLPTSLDELEAALRSGIDPVATPSVAYGVSRGGETILSGAAGLANKEKGIAATPDTRYSLASVSKPMTTTAVRLLAERGLVDLSAPINDYLGEAKIQSRAGDAREATVWRVADHTAGLPLHYQFYYEDEPYVRPPMDETIRRYAKLFTPAGERHYYSNLGYGLLDTLIERVSGRSYHDFMRDELFAPLGMTKSSVGGPGTDDEAVAYGPDGVGYPHYDFDHPGGSAIYASVEDLLAFGRFHLGHGPGLLSREAREEMRRRTAFIDATRGYGFGWGVNEDRLGLRVVQHTGFMGGVSAVLTLVPELDLAIAVAINGQTDRAWKSAENVLAALHPDFRARLAEERAKPAAETKTELVPEALFGAWTGVIETYRAMLPFTLDVRGGGEAVARLNGTELPVEELQIRDGRLLGVFDGDLGTDDAARREYRVHLDLRPRGQILNGAAVTISKTENGGGGAPGQRFGNALAYWTDLRRA